MNIMIKNILTLIVRLVLNLIIQVATIYFFLHFNSSNPIGYLLLFLPFTVPLITAVNVVIIGWSLQTAQRQPSELRRRWFPLAVLIGIAIICYLFVVIPSEVFSLFIIIYVYMGFPALVIELMVRMIFFNTNKLNM